MVMFKLSFDLTDDGIEPWTAKSNIDNRSNLEDFESIPISLPLVSPYLAQLQSIEKLGERRKLEHGKWKPFDKSFTFMIKLIFQPTVKRSVLHTRFARFWELVVVCTLSTWAHLYLWSGWEIKTKRTNIYYQRSYSASPCAVQWSGEAGNVSRKSFTILTCVVFQAHTYVFFCSER